MCNYEVIEKNKAGVIVRDAIKVRCYNDGSEMLYCIRDLFNACKLNSVDAAMKSIVKVVDDDPKAKLTLVWFPFCTPRAGWRTTKMYFANEYAFRMYMRGRYIPKEIKTWLVEDVFTFKLDALCETADDKQIGLNEQLPDTKPSESKTDNVLELGKLLEKNEAVKIACTQTRNADDLNEAISKMVLAMLDVMKILVANRSYTEKMVQSEKAAS